jgi:ABC-type glycerol-3-phosphate transport system substrate-binding protein
MRVRTIILSATLALAPHGARAADLVVWWDMAYYPEEDKALAELAQAFKEKTGLKIEFVRYDGWEAPAKVKAAIAAGQPPDFAFSLFF